jgi:hypothetical protein
MTEEQQITVEQAERVLRAEYWDDVRTMAEDARRAVKDGEVTDADGMNDWLWETVDGTGRVIYTAQAMDGLRWSEHDDAYFDEGLYCEEDFRDGIPWSKLMFCAMLADVREDLGDFDPLFETEDDDAEAEA